MSLLRGKALLETARRRCGPRTAADDQKTLGWTEPGPRFSKVDIYLGRNRSKILIAAVPRKV